MMMRRRINATLILENRVGDVFECERQFNELLEVGIGSKKNKSTFYIKKDNSIISKIHKIAIKEKKTGP